MSRIRGAVLLALARSADAEERAVAQEVIAEAIRAAGSIPAAARALAVARSTLYRVCNPEGRALPRRGPGRPRRTLPSTPGTPAS